MHVWIILVLVFFRSMSASLANISRIVMAEGLESLPEDLLAEIGSRVNSVPNYVQKVVNGDDAGILSSVLYDRFGWQECLIAALLIEEAPGGVVVQVITNFLQYDNQIPSGAMENALEIAYTSGHCPKIIKMLSDRLPTSRALPPGCEKARDIYDCVMSADNSCRSSVHLSDLLKMHALPRNTFMDVLAAKYSNDLGSFFNDCKRCGGIPSITMMSHAVHIYRLLNGVRDFEPIPYARILSNGSIPNAIIETNLPLDYEGHSGLEVYRRHIHFPVLHNLQIVLSPSSEINFFTNMSREGRIKFLFEACTSGRLDWVKFMVNNELWNDVELTASDFIDFQIKWVPRKGKDVMRYADVIVDGDPVISAFRMLFRHQRFHSVCQFLLSQDLHPSARKIVDDYFLPQYSLLTAPFFLRKLLG